jgi:hypothetical protein
MAMPNYFLIRSKTVGILNKLDGELISTSLYVIGINNRQNNPGRRFGIKPGTAKQQSTIYRRAIIA